MIVCKEVQKLLTLRGTMRYLFHSDVGYCVPVKRISLPFFQIAHHCCLEIANSGRLSRWRLRLRQCGTLWALVLVGARFAVMWHLHAFNTSINAITQQVRQQKVPQVQRHAYGPVDDTRGSAR
jgi:hypothetical protein